MAPHEHETVEEAKECELRYEWSMDQQAELRQELKEERAYWDDRAMM